MKYLLYLSHHHAGCSAKHQSIGWLNSGLHFLLITTPAHCWRLHTTDPLESWGCLAIWNSVNDFILLGCTYFIMYSRVKWSCRGQSDVGINTKSINNISMQDSFIVIKLTRRKKFSMFHETQSDPRDLQRAEMCLLLTPWIHRPLKMHHLHPK